jgi:hypothetical protein
MIETETKSTLLTHIYMTPNTHMHDPSHSWIDMRTSIKAAGID